MGKPHDDSCDDYLHCCLYFAAMTLSRAVNQMAEEEFMATGLPPTYAFLVMVVNGREGVTQKELGERLHLAPSTISRFVDKLVRKKILRTSLRGKSVLVYPTGKGKELQGEIVKSWEKLYRRYSDILGEKKGERLTAEIDRAGLDLERGL